MAIPVAETIQSGLGCAFIEGPRTSPMLRLDALRPHLQGNWGVKLGMCALDIESFRAVASLLSELAPPLRIWDPIQAPSMGIGLHSGAELRRQAGILLKDGQWVVSPNRLEAGALSGIFAQASPEALARPWLDAGARAVWLKGGHAQGDRIEDVWVTHDGAMGLESSPRLPGERRGTGCTLASAWLGYRLGAHDDVQAAGLAVRWLRNHWGSAFSPGGAGRPSFFPVTA